MFPFSPEMLVIVLAALGGDELNDKTLSKRIRLGDQKAFKLFFDQHHASLYHYLKRRNLPHQVCEDLVQQAFVIIWEKRANIDDRKSLRSFLFTIGHNRALNHFRDHARFVGEPQPDAQIAPDSPEADTAHLLIKKDLMAAIELLPDRRRAVFELCFVQELTYKEAAEILEISPKTVENQMGHAFKSIRKALADHRP